MNDLQLPPDFTDSLGSSLGAGAVPYVSIQGNRFTFIDSSGDTEAVTTVDPKTGVPYLDCVIIDAGDVASKIYYGHAFDPAAGSYAPPDCWSDNGVAPSMNCSNPQAVSCAPDPQGVSGCKWAVWGSATSKVSGKGVPACGTYRKLALLIPGDDIQFLLRVPPNSLDNLRTYTHKFKGHAFGIRDVVTRISFEAGGIGTLTFTGREMASDEIKKQRNEALMAKKTDALVGRGDKPRGAPAPLAISAPIASSPVSAPVETPSPLSAPVQGSAATPVSAPTPQAGVAAPNAPTRRGRRSKADAAPATGEPVAPFREPAQTNSQFGMSNAPAPNAELEDALKSVFG